MMKFTFKHLNIRIKLMSYFVVITIIFAGISGVSYFISSNQSKQVSSIVVDYVFLSDLNESILSLDHEVENFLISRSSSSLLNYYNIVEELNQQKQKLSRIRSYDPSKMLMRNISFTLSAYMEQADLAVEGKRGRNTGSYIESYERMGQLSSYLSTDIDQLLALKLKEGSRQYDQAMTKTDAISWFSFFLIAGSLMMGLGLSSYMTLSITKPLTKLTESAERVAKGDFEVAPLSIKSNDEIEILAEAFNEMLSNIREHIDYLTLQSELENNLNEQLMQNLSMKSLLKEAELKRLQAQINPHFLYNTLNAASQLSMIEGADKTSEFIQKIAMYFRYMLRKIGQNVTIREELENVETYMYILKTRFGERINFETSIDERLLDYTMPSTVIQPIVENAYIHGLEDWEENGVIQLNLFEVGDRICLEVRDNGKGMDEETLEALLDFSKPDEAVNQKSSSGIGMQNVVERLRHFSADAKADDIVQVTSVLGEGTSIQLWLPKIKENEANA